MNALEKILTALGVVGAIFAMGVAWNSLDARIERMDIKIGSEVARVATKVEALEKANATTPCLAILTRQIEAIERDKAVARRSLEALSESYQCGLRPTLTLRVPRPSQKGWRLMQRHPHSPLAQNRPLARRLRQIDDLLDAE